MATTGVINYAIEIDFTSQGDHTDLINENYGIHNGVLRAITGRNPLALFDYNSLNGSFVVGEVVRGQTSGARGRVLKALDGTASTTGTFIYFPIAGTFQVGETIKRDTPDANEFICETAPKDAFKTQFLLKNSISSPAKYINIDGSGGYASFSTLKFRLDNADNPDPTKYLWFFLQQNEIVVKNASVKLFIVSDNVPGTLFPVWSGTVNDNPRTETDYIISCIDDFKKIHKQIPNQFIDRNRFPNLDVNEEGAFIPATFGRLFNNKLIQVNQDPGKLSPLVLYNAVTADPDIMGDLSPVVEMATSYAVVNSKFSGAIITILVGEVTITEDQLVGSFVFAELGKGSGEYRLITANTANFIPTPGEPEVIELTVSETAIETKRTLNAGTGFQETPDIFIFEGRRLDQSLPDNANIGQTDSKDLTYISIVTFKKSFLIGDNEIFSIDDEFNLIERGLHLKTNGKVDQLKSLEATFDTSNIDNLNFPGVKLESGALTPSNEVSLTRAVETNITIAGMVGYTSFGTPLTSPAGPFAQSYPTPAARNTIYDQWDFADGSERSKLNDRNPVVAYDVNWGDLKGSPDSFMTHVQGITNQFTNDWIDEQKQIRFACDLEITDFDSLSDLDEIFVGTNFQFRWTNRNQPTVDIAELLRISIVVTAIDKYGREINSDPITNGTSQEPVAQVVLYDWVMWDKDYTPGLLTKSLEFNFFPREYFINGATSGLDDVLFYENKDALNITDFIKQDKMKDILKALRISVRVQTASYAVREPTAGGGSSPEPSDNFKAPLKLRAFTVTDAAPQFNYRDILRNSIINLSVSEVKIESSPGQNRHPYVLIEENETNPLSGSTVYGDQTFNTTSEDIDLFNGTNTAIDVKMIEVNLFGNRKVDVEGIRTGAVGTIWSDLNNGPSSPRSYFDIVQTLPMILEYILMRYDGLQRETDIDTQSFTDANALTSRSDFYYSRQILEQQGTFNVINELVEQGIMAIYADQNGRRKIKSYLDDKTPIQAFSPTNIMTGSLSMGKSPVSKVYTEFVLDYDFSVADNEFLRRLRVTKAEETTFPSIDERELVSNLVNPFNEILQNPDVDFFEIRSSSQITDIIPGVTVVSISATGSSLFDNIEYAEVLSNKAVPGVGYIVQVKSTTVLNFQAGPFILGDVDVYKAQKTWQTYCEGFTDGEYNIGREIWQAMRAGYQRTQKITPLPSSLSQAYWFHRTENSDDADNEIALKYLSLLKDWVTFTKDKPKFRIPTVGNETLNLMDTVSFTDPVLTKDIVRIGWITNLVYDTKLDEIEVTLTLDLDPTDPFIVVDTVDEGLNVASGSEPADDVDELANISAPSIPADDIDENF